MDISFEEIMACPNIQSFKDKLTRSNCDRCSLSDHPNSVVVSRGNPNSKIMLIGEAPALHEDLKGMPFVGPAGQLLDKIMESIGVDTNRDCFCTNSCRCRPIASLESGKQNYTPTAKHCNSCLPYLLKEIELIRPKIIVSVGSLPLKYLFKVKDLPMNMAAGKVHQPNRREINESVCFCIYHPAYILHCEKRGIQAVKEAKDRMWKDVRELKNIISSLEIQLTGRQL